LHRTLEKNIEIRSNPTQAIDEPNPCASLM